MNANDLFILGLKSRVSAISRHDGQILWSAELVGGIGDGFVTVTSDEKRVYAYTKGRLNCLDLFSGEIVWTNELTGYGYGIASLCVPGVSTALDAAAYARIHADAESAATTNPVAT